MSFGDRLLAWLPWIFATFIIAGIVHLVSILAMPRLATEDAFARIARVAPLHRLTILAGEPAAMKLLPFEDPATAVAVCRFDLSMGPLRLRGKLAGDGLTLMSFRNRFGASFYAMTDRGTSRGSLDVIILTRSQLEAKEADDPEDELPSELRLVSPSIQGLVMLRALAPEKGFYPQAVEGLKAITCKLESQPGSGTNEQGS
jgi:uncharacterized membrane protein